MAGFHRTRARVRQRSARKAVEGSKRTVYLDMIDLVNLAMEDLKGPEMEVKTYPCDDGFQSVSVSFDASKIPFHINSGTPELGVAIFGSKFVCGEKAEHDAVIKVGGYLFSNFGLRIVDWSYEKILRAEEKCQEVDNSIQETVCNIKSMFSNWKASVGLFKNMETALSCFANPLHLGVKGKLSTMKCLLEATLDHISAKMVALQKEHVQYLKEIDSKFQQDAITLKIPETNIINDILFSLGVEQAKCSNTLHDNDMFRGTCKIKFNGIVTSKTAGPTSIEGDVKNTAFEAECSAAYKAINFLERVMDIEVVDLNFPVLVEKQQLVKSLQCLKNNYVSIEHEVAAQWESMIIELKALVNSEYAVCNQLNLDLPETDRIDCAHLLEESLADITLLFDLSITGSEQFS